MRYYSLAGKVVDGAAEALLSRNKSEKLNAKWSFAIDPGKCKLWERRENPKTLLRLEKWGHTEKGEVLAETETVGLESVVCERKKRRGKAKETRKRNWKSKWGLVDHRHSKREDHNNSKWRESWTAPLLSTFISQTLCCISSKVLTIIWSFLFL